MRIKLSIFGHEIYEFIVGKEEDLSALLGLLEKDEEGIVRFGGNDQCSFEVEPGLLDLEEEEWEEEERFGFNARSTNNRRAE
jgi:hypothetical protein